MVVEQEGINTQLPQSSYAVVVDNLSKVYSGDVKAVEGVSFGITEGSIAGVVGPNGAGKSTVLNIMATLLRPTSGTVSILGVPIHNARKIRKMMGVALQDVGLDPIMTGSEHFRMQAAQYGLKSDLARARELELCKWLALEEYMDRSAGLYSFGTQKRLAIALALIHDPSIVILDEPTSGVDPHSRQEVWRIIRQLKADGKTIIFSTHYMEEADQLCDNVYLITHGKLVASGTPEELKLAVGKFSLRLKANHNLDELQTFISGGLGVSLDEMYVDNGTLIGQELPNGVTAQTVFSFLTTHDIDVVECSLTGGSLESFFLEAIKGHSEPLRQNQGADLTRRMFRGGGKQWH